MDRHDRKAGERTRFLVGAAAFAGILLAFSCTRTPIQPLGARIVKPRFEGAVPNRTYRSAVTVILGSDHSGTSIRYSTDPAAEIGVGASWQDYTGPLAIGATTTIRCYAFLDPSNPSELATGVYTLKVPDPVISARASVSAPPLLVDIDCELAGASIFYTTDGSDPLTGTGLAYSPFRWETAGTTVMAAATRAGWVDSDVTVASISIDTGGTAITLSLSPMGGTFNTPQRLIPTCGDPAAILRYTTDGSAPSFLNGEDFPSTGLLVDATTTIRLAAMRTGHPSFELAAPQTYTMVAATPQFSLAAGTYLADQSLALSTSTPGATIYYTIAYGSMPPAPTAATGTPYSGPIAINRTATVIAGAFRTYWTDGISPSRTYTMQVADPVFSLPGAPTYAAAQSLNLSTATSGATIDYTIDGVAQPSYTAPLAVSAGATYVATASRPGWSPSNPASLSYSFAAIVPSYSPPGATFDKPLFLYLQSATPGPGASIRYTIASGSTPPAPTASTGTLYSGPIAIGQTSTIVAGSFRTGWNTAIAAPQTYTMQVADPVFSLPAGAYAAGQSLAITTATPGATIDYTINSVAQPSYSAPFLVAAGSTIVATASRSNWTQSGSVAAVYSFDAAAPSYSPPGGTFDNPFFLYLQSATPGPGASIRYAIGPAPSAPTSGTGTVYSGPILIDLTTKVIAGSFRTGWTDALTASQTYTMQARTPRIIPSLGSLPVSVSFFTGTMGADLYYTTNGDDPATLGIPYADLPISLAGPGPVTVRVIARRANWTDSLIASATFN
jgi:hypothetical protein